jgi:hypothetical protein
MPFPLDLAVAALKAELARCDGDLTLFESEPALRELMNAGLSPKDAEKVLDDAQELLGLRDD